MCLLGVGRNHVTLYECPEQARVSHLLLLQTVLTEESYKHQFLVEMGFQLAKLPFRACSAEKASEVPASLQMFFS